MVARMTLAQIAQYLEVDEHLAHAVLNRIGVVSPASSEDTTLTPGRPSSDRPHEVAATTRSVRITGRPCSTAIRAWARAPLYSPASTTMVAKP